MKKRHHPFLAIRSRVRRETRKIFLSYLKTLPPAERKEGADLLIQADIHPERQRPARLLELEDASLRWGLPARDVKRTSCHLYDKTNQGTVI